MVMKIRKVILLKKFRFLVFFIFLYFIFIYFSLFNFFYLSFDYFFLLKESWINYSISVSFDFISLIFLIIVRLVVTLVGLYSEIYMEHYNNKKFFFLMFFFYLTMIFLSFRNSFFFLMIGWDGLGLTSLILIIFYPNKLTIFNSFLTIFFNRLGDIILIFLISFFLLNFSNFYSLNYSLNSNLILTLFFICICTKRAQFPLSSWLPAAISAPTPISAMVHSSTLVTAGVYLMLKLYTFFFFFPISYFMLFLGVLSFLLGGLIANLELDLKKIVAFSTISQIRIIIFFGMMSFFRITLLHMFFHAIFKTLLFCCCGVLFLFNFNDQFFKNLNFKFNFFLGSNLLFYRVFRITGLIFSTSFFRKDLILENSFNNLEIFSFLLLLRGRILTIFYSIKIFIPFFCRRGMNYIGFFKYFNFSFLLIFGLNLIFLGFFLKNFIFVEIFSILDYKDLIIINFLILSPFFFFFFNSKFFYYFGLEISFIKFFNFKILGEPLFFWSFYQQVMRDVFIFNKNYFFLKIKKINFFFKLNKFLYRIIFLLFLKLLT